jgi:hypothetical protein
MGSVFGSAWWMSRADRDYDGELDAEELAAFVLAVARPAVDQRWVARALGIATSQVFHRFHVHLIERFHNELQCRELDVGLR